jgi:hypothetical protein
LAGKHVEAHDHIHAAKEKAPAETSGALLLLTYL